MECLAMCLLLMAVPVKFVSLLECTGCITTMYDDLIESFNDTAVTDFQLSQAGSVASLKNCLLMCGHDIRCRSYRHNALTNTCSIYGSGYSVPQNTYNTATAEAGSRLYAMCGMTGSFASSCSSSADCNVANSFCSSGRCHCNIGSSYNVHTGQCIDRCEAYGNTFDLWPESGLVGYNTISLVTSTQDACKDACRVDTSIACINAEFDIADGTCFLNDVPWSEIDPASIGIGIYPGWIMYHRHCAY